MLDNLEIASVILRMISRRHLGKHVEQVNFVDVEAECKVPDLMAYVYFVNGDVEPILLAGLRGLGREAHDEIEAVVKRGMAADAIVRMH